jgi:large subunit ribosomal protein L30
MSKIVIVRISGRVGLRKEVNSTLDRLRLRKKYVCVVLENPSKEQEGMIKFVKEFVAFGEISEEVYKKLVEARGKKDKEGKLKPFFRLHPPRKGINSKLHFPKGVLGNNKDKINDLIIRML